jgi:AmmeMemoRadiSam system protein A
MHLSEDEKNALRQLAKDAIESSLFKRKETSVEVSATLKEKRGAFVTLRKKGELRGCIGYIRGVSPLYKTVREMATQAAFHDPRFSALDKSEWEDIEIEISVLTPMKKVASIDEIEVGVHGLYIEKGYYAGLLLPQVATENGWDKITFLEYTCYKAGLPKDSYKAKDANIYIFSADVF